MWVERYDLGGLDALRDLPKSGRPWSVPRDHGSVGRGSSPGMMHARKAAEACARADWQETTHHLHPKDHACAPIDAERTAADSYQQGG